MRRADKFKRPHYWQNVGVEMLLTLLVALPIGALVFLILSV